MLTFDSIPQARVVRKGGQLYAPPPAPRSSRKSAMLASLRDGVAMAIGLWPLTGAALLAAGLMYLAAMSGNP